MGRPASSAPSAASPAATSFKSSSSKAAAVISKKRHSSASLGSAATDDDQQLESKPQLDPTAARPKRRATNAHIFRYLQHGNPNRLQDRDLKRALEASLEDCSQDVWPAEDTASCSSSDQSNAPSAASTASNNTSTQRNQPGHRLLLSANPRHRSQLSSASLGDPRRRSENGNSIECNCRHGAAHNNNSSNNASLRHHQQNQTHATSANTHANNHNQIQCPVHAQKRPKVHKRFKPVAKKNIYYEADFFHEGIMEYISFELVKFSLLGDPERMKRVEESVEEKRKLNNKLAQA